MEQVRLYPETVFQYGDMLAQTYRREILGMCIAVIRECGERSSNRKEYQKLCALIALLAEFGGQGEAQTLIAELRQGNPRKVALLDELRQMEQTIAKK